MMTKSGLRGPYPLTKEDIGENVTRQLPGAYAFRTLGKRKILHRLCRTLRF